MNRESFAESGYFESQDKRSSSQPFSTGTEISSVRFVIAYLAKWGDDAP